MSTREYYYNTETEEYAVAVEDAKSWDADDAIIFTIGAKQDKRSSDYLADDQWILITADNADLFIDEIHKELSRLNSVLPLLEGLLD